MQRAIADAEFKNEEALVHLAMLQMTRDNDVSDDDGKNDFDRAKVNLQRALAINDSYMPAFNQLAVYYLESAKKKAGQKTRGGRVTAASERKNKADPQMLELAQLVCSQALRKNPSYAPVYNTTGLIMAELGDLSQAARSFASARKLDPKFFEAHMNYAAVNLQFRGFEQAEEAYKQALKLQPNEFEAHLGRALALRGLINDSNFDQMLAESAKEIAEARRLDADRPETYYNEAILTQEFKARQGESEPMLLKAKGLFDDFIKKASGKDEYKDAAARATERIKDIDQMVEFNRQTKEEQKRMEEERKRMEAEQAIKDQAAGATPGGGEPK
jgi:Flp pilus assembly protein TadD